MQTKFLVSAAVGGIAVIALAATDAFAVFEHKPTNQTIPDEVEPDPQSLSEYLRCSNLAEAHVLSPSYARHCADVYLAVKLSFLPDVDPADYRGLTIEQRRAAQISGYAAFRRWKEANIHHAQSE